MIPKLDLVPVRLDSGVVILHTPEEYARLMKGVDLEVVAKFFAELEED